MARAKNTTRAEARRRSRAMTRAEIEAAELDEDAEAITDADEPATERRPSGFKLPNFRQDLRDLPQILTSRRAMIVAPLILVVGFLLQIGRGAIPADYGLPVPLAGFLTFRDMSDLFVQVFVVPPALLTFFLAGYIAPRASYLVGALLGVLSGVLSIIVVLGAPLPAEVTPGAPTDMGTIVVYLLALNVGYGTFAAAFAAWYRDFLRRMRDQGMARRTDREAQERARRRDKRQSDRQALKRGSR